MKHSALIQNLRDEQRHEMMRKIAAERLAIALELSDACIALNGAAKKAIEEKRATRELFTALRTEGYINGFAALPYPPGARHEPQWA